MDSRVTPANGRVAANFLKGKVNSEHFLEGSKAQCGSGPTDLLNAHDGNRVSQLSLGDPIKVFERLNGFAYIQSEKDQYCGYISESYVAPRTKLSHWVYVAGSNSYIKPDFKQKDMSEFFLGDKVTVKKVTGVWAELNSGGFIPVCHLKKIENQLVDYVATSRLLLNSPYLWGGGSRKGIDCSGLVQLALNACGVNCPRDTDMQEESVGNRVKLTEARKGDLVFWRGHVGILSEDDTLIHANAYHMAVVEEDFNLVMARIEKSDGGAVTSIKRL